MSVKIINIETNELKIEIITCNNKINFKEVHKKNRSFGN